MEKTIERDKQVIQYLLRQVAAIHKKHDEIARATGEKFNVFRVLKIHADEVKMHSALLGELLKPNGSHGKGSIFLELFIKRFNLAANTDLQIAEFHYKGATVEPEKYIGEKTETTGGRIDLLITDGKGKKIIIENKIYAGDQEQQLIRYYNHDRNAALCYLTLDGKQPNDTSIKYQNSETNDFFDLTGKFTPLSYEFHIVEWLEDCLKEAAKHSMLRETIAQYINLVKFLTNQSTNQIMQQEIIDLILKDKESTNSAIEIVESGDLIKRAIIAKLAESLNNNGYEISVFAEGKPLGYPETGIKFIKRKEDKYCVAIEFANYDRIDIGVCKQVNFAGRPETEKEIFKKLSAFFPNPEKSPSWPWYCNYKLRWDEYSWGAVANGEFKTVLLEDVQNIFEIVGDLMK